MNQFVSNLYTTFPDFIKQLSSALVCKKSCINMCDSPVIFVFKPYIYFLGQVQVTIWKPPVILFMSSLNIFSHQYSITSLSLRDVLSFALQFAVSTKRCKISIRCISNICCKYIYFWEVLNCLIQLYKNMCQFYLSVQKIIYRAIQLPFALKGGVSSTF